MTQETDLLDQLTDLIAAKVAARMEAPPMPTIDLDRKAAAWRLAEMLKKFNVVCADRDMAVERVDVLVLKLGAATAARSEAEARAARLDDGNAEVTVALRCLRASVKSRADGIEKAVIAALASSPETMHGSWLVSELQREIDDLKALL